jgi:hypothetical protein
VTQNSVIFVIISKTQFSGRPTSGDFAVKGPKLLLKLAAVASSLVLVGGLVGYRAGAFSKSMPTRTESIERPTVEQPAAEKQHQFPVFMGSSKSRDLLGNDW